MKSDLTESEWPIIGHQNVINFLKKCLINNQLNHAYLFYGAQNIGKSTVAKIFSQAIICEKKDRISLKIPCNICNNCLSFKKNIFPDSYQIDLLEDKQDIGIEQIKLLQSQLKLKSFQESFKIAIINNADKLNNVSANALLKTLEEPFGKTIIILLAENLKNILPTIVSRCQAIKFQAVNDELVYDYVVSQGNNREIARLITNLIQGRIGLIFHEDFSEFLQKFDKEISLLEEIINSPAYRKIKIIDTLTKTNGAEEVKQLLNNWLMYFRDIFYVKIDQVDKIINYKNIKNLQNLEKKYNLRQLIEILKTFCQIPKQMNLNINSKLLLENLILNI